MGYDVAPDGKRGVFVARGDVFTVPVVGPSITPVGADGISSIVTDTSALTQSVELLRRTVTKYVAFGVRPVNVVLAW